MGNSLSIPNFSSRWEDKIKFPTWYIDNPSVNKRSEQKCMTDLTNILNCSLPINARIKLYKINNPSLHSFNIATDSCSFLKNQFLDRLIITCPGIYNVIFPLRNTEYTEVEESAIIENVFNEFVYIPVQLFFENPQKASDIASSLCRDYYNKYNFTCDAFANLTSAAVHVIHNCIGDDFSGESKRSWERHLSLLFNAYIHLPQIENQYNNNTLNTNTNTTNTHSTPNTANTHNTTNTANTSNTNNFYNDMNIITPPDCRSSSTSSISSQKSYNSSLPSSPTCYNSNNNNSNVVLSTKPQIKSTFELQFAKRLPWIIWENGMFSINNEVFDMEHKEIVYIINSLYYHVISDSPYTIIYKTTQVLSIIISIHLYDEEKIYHTSDYPNKQEHDVSHVYVTKHLEELTNSLTSKEYTKNEKMKLICNFLNEVLPFDEDSDRKLGNYIYQQYLLNGNITLSSDYGDSSSLPPSSQLQQQLSSSTSTSTSTITATIEHTRKTLAIDDDERLTIPEPIDEAIKRVRNDDINHSNSNSSCETVEEKTDICELSDCLPNKKRK